MTTEEINNTIKLLNEVIKENKGSTEPQSFLIIADAREKIRELIKQIQP